VMIGPFLISPAVEVAAAAVASNVGVINVTVAASCFMCYSLNNENHRSECQRIVGISGRANSKYILELLNNMIYS